MAAYAHQGKIVLQEDRFSRRKAGLKAAVVVTSDSFKPTIQLLEALLVDLAEVNNGASVAIFGEGRFEDPIGFDVMGTDGILLTVSVRSGDRSEKDIEAYLTRLIEVLDDPSTVLEHTTTHYHKEVRPL